MRLAPRAHDFMTTADRAAIPGNCQAVHVAYDAIVAIALAEDRRRRAGSVNSFYEELGIGVWVALSEGGESAKIRIPSYSMWAFTS